MTDLEKSIKEYKELHCIAKESKIVRAMRRKIRGEVEGAQVVEAE